MKTPQDVINNYIILTFLYTLSAAFIWGINTLFLLDAGLSNAQAFSANAAATLGGVLFEIPTGVVADLKGRKTSFILGALTLMASTAFYILLWNINGHIVLWYVASLLLGLGFTFFSGALEAWLVDALKFTKYSGTLDSVFSKGQITSGVAMLLGAFAGGLIAQLTNLSVPYIVRTVVLLITTVVAFVLMKDLGFKAEKNVRVKTQIATIWRASIKYGVKKPSVFYIMLATAFAFGGSFYAFYALQPYLLELYGTEDSYIISGAAASLVALAQIFGGLSSVFIRRIFNKRTSSIMLATIIALISIVLIGLTSNFWVALVLIVIWALTFAASQPIRQAYINEQIPSKQRATVLSFDSAILNVGQITFQPPLGRAADIWGYSISFVLAGVIQIIALPFILLARRTKPKADLIK